MLVYLNNVHIFEPMKIEEFYTKYCKIKQIDGTFAKPIATDFSKWIFEELDKGKTLKIVKGRTTRIISS
jgi:hypothetical protein